MWLTNLGYDEVIRPSIRVVHVQGKNSRICDVCEKEIKYGHYNCRNPNRDAWTAIVYLDTPARNGRTLGQVLKCHRLNPQQILERREAISGVIVRLMKQGQSFRDALEQVVSVVDLI